MTSGIVLSVILGVLIALVCLWIGYFLLKKITFLHNPVFIPSRSDQLDDALGLFSLAEPKRVIDLGSGDGTALLSLAQKFPRSQIVGVEINPWLAHISRKRIRDAGLSERVIVQRMSFWQVDFAQYDRIYLYGSGYIMEELEKKVAAEVQPGTQLVSVRFPFPSLPIIKTKGEALLYRL